MKNFYSRAKRKLKFLLAIPYVLLLSLNIHAQVVLNEAMNSAGMPAGWTTINNSTMGSCVTNYNWTWSSGYNCPASVGSPKGGVIAFVSSTSSCSAVVSNVWLFTPGLALTGGDEHEPIYRNNHSSSTETL